jgi:hypothetical protein
MRNIHRHGVGSIDDGVSNLGKTVTGYFCEEERTSDIYYLRYILQNIETNNRLLK